MKKKTVLNILIVAAIAVIGFSLTSCINDNYEPIPVKLNDINGKYRARLVTSQGGMFNEKIIDFTAKDSIITFGNFPVREIVKSIVNDPVKADSVLAQLGKIEYKLNFKPKLNPEQNVVELTFEPKILSFQMTLDGVIKNVSVLMAAKQKGFFVGYDRSMRFAWEAEKITVGGVDLAPYQSIKYEIPISIKN